MSSRSSRRQALKWLAALPFSPLLPSVAHAIGPGAKVRLAQLLYRGGRSVPRASSLGRLAWEVEKRTAVDVALDPVQMRITDRDLFRHPFLYLGGDSQFSPWSAEEVARLRRYLVHGGFLLVDSAEAQPGGPFDQGIRQLCKELFPKTPLARLPTEHTVSRSFYLLERPVGRVATIPYLEGITQDGRALLVYCQNDLAGAWARDNFGQWEYSVYPGRSRQRELAMRWGVNLVMYALCLDYKADQVHIPFILKRRRWRVTP